MKLFGVAMMKDEVDIADHIMYHFANQGVDGLIIADNLSTDGTREKLEEARCNIHTKYPDIYIEIKDDNIVAYTQGDKMSNLAAYAGTLGATWIIPFDADELWFAHEGTLKEAVTKIDAEGYRTVKTGYYDYRITEEDGIEEIPFMRLKWRKPEIINFKTAFKYHNPTSISNGNHFVFFNHNGSDRDENPSEALYIKHFGIRSREHFIKKYSNAYKACKALPPNADLYNGAAWNLYFDAYETGGEEELGRVFDYNWKGLDGLVLDPAPFIPWEN